MSREAQDSEARRRYKSLIRLSRIGGARSRGRTHAKRKYGTPLSSVISSQVGCFLFGSNGVMIAFRGPSARSAIIPLRHSENG